MALQVALLFSGIDKEETLTDILDTYKMMLKYGITSYKIQNYFFDVFIHNELKQSHSFTIELYITPCNAYAPQNINELLIKSGKYYAHSHSRPQTTNTNVPLTYKWTNTIISSYHNLQTKVHLIGNVTPLLRYLN